MSWHGTTWLGYELTGTPLADAQDLSQTTTNSFIGPLIQLNLGELPPETYSLYSALGITVTASVTAVPSNHFPRFYVQIIRILVRNRFMFCSGPTSLSGFAFSLWVVLVKLSVGTCQVIGSKDSSEEA